jgi:hypothetical protein
MLAITISCAGRLRASPATDRPNCCLSAICKAARLQLLAALFCASLLPLCAQSPGSEARARELFNVARTRFESERSNVAAAWQFGRAAYDLAHVTDNNDERRAAAEAGMSACRHAIALAPDAAPAHYYLALNLGEFAQARKLAALKSLHEMESEFMAALNLDPKFDSGGPDRSLGMLYLEAPSWPLSLGNKNKARSHLQAAVQVSPDHPENRICLAEAYAQWGELNNLESELTALEKLMPGVRQRFEAPAWQDEWNDWQKRIAQLRKVRDRLTAGSRPSAAERGAKSAK